MGYRSDVRIVTSKEGYEKLNEFVQKFLKERNIDYNFLDECDIKKEKNNQCYFGWNYVKWYEDDYDEVIAIMKGLDYLNDNDYSYRYSRIGESYDDYDEQYFDGNRKGELYLEYPSLIRAFDDEYVISMLKEIPELNNDKEEQKEDIDI